MAIPCGPLIAIKLRCRGHSGIEDRDRDWKGKSEGLGLLPALLLSFAGFCRNPAPNGLERLNVGRLPPLRPLYHVELHGLTFLQALETT